MNKNPEDMSDAELDDVIAVVCAASSDVKYIANRDGGSLLSLIEAARQAGIFIWYEPVPDGHLVLHRMPGNVTGAIGPVATTELLRTVKEQFARAALSHPAPNADAVSALRSKDQSNR